MWVRALADGTRAEGGIAGEPLLNCLWPLSVQKVSTAGGRAGTETILMMGHAGMVGGWGWGWGGGGGGSVCAQVCVQASVCVCVCVCVYVRA